MKDKMPFVRIPKTLAFDDTVQSTTKGVYVVLASHCNDSTRTGVPSRKKIAGAAGVSNSSLTRHLKILEDRGYISIETRFSKLDGKRMTNTYILHDV